MSEAPYRWRRLTSAERGAVLAERRARRLPLHSPPHRANFDQHQFLITAACYEHEPHIGQSDARMDDFTSALLEHLRASSAHAHAWCILPNHYHVLIETRGLLPTLHALGRFHGRMAFRWNAEDARRGRKVFFRAQDRAMRSDAHYWATLNYVHHNAVRHGYVERAIDWPWSSARAYVEDVGVEDAARTWRDFPIREYGAGWDEPGL